MHVFRQIREAVTLMLLSLLVILIVSGCEVNSVEKGIAISPSDVTLTSGQSQMFKVSGGYDSYTWSLVPDDGTAALNPRTGDTVVFTLNSATSASSNAWTNITIKCVSIIPGVSVETTNITSTSTASGYNYTAEAHVNFRIQ